MARDYASLQRKPFLAPIWLSILSAFIAVAMFAVAAWVGWAWGTAHPTTIVVVQEAESETGSSDPPLTPAGEARAESLSRLLGATRTAGRLEAIYASPARRSLMTAAPLASRLGVTPIMADTLPGPEIRSLTRRVLREQAGGRALIVGQRNTVPEIVRMLSGGTNVPPIPDDVYGTMYIISVPRVGRANLLQLTY